MVDRVQTGLRIPEDLYYRLRAVADKAGVSVNAQILFLIDVGLRAIDLGIQAERHDPSRTQKDTSE